MKLALVVRLLNENFQMTAEEENKDDQLQLVKGHVAGLMEHFDTVQIIATRHTNDGTALYCWGGGNYFAREGSVREWLVKGDERTRVNVRQENE